MSDRMSLNFYSWCLCFTFGTAELDHRSRSSNDELKNGSVQHLRMVRASQWAQFAEQNIFHMAETNGSSLSKALKFTWQGVVGGKTYKYLFDQREMWGLPSYALSWRCMDWFGCFNHWSPMPIPEVLPTCVNKFSAFEQGCDLQINVRGVSWFEKVELRLQFTCNMFFFH